MGVLRVAPALLALTTSAAADVDGTLEALQAPRVRRYVSVAPTDDGKTLNFTIDDAQIDAPAKADTPISIVGNGSIAFLVASYNPFTMKLSLADALFDDPNVAALTKGLAGIIAAIDKESAQKTTAALAAAGDLPPANLDLSRPPIASKTGAPAEAACDHHEVVAHLATYRDEIAAAKLDSAQLADWVREATGRDAIGTVGHKIAQHGRSLGEHLEQATTALAWLDTWFRQRTRERQEAVTRRKNLNARHAELEAKRVELVHAHAIADQAERKRIAAQQREIAARLTENARAAAELPARACDEAFATALLFFRSVPEAEVERVKTLHAQLAELARAFARISARQRWYDRAGGRDAGFIFGSRQTLEDKGRLVTVKVQRLAPRIHDDVIELELTETSASLQVRLRERNMFAFEVVPALVYSFLQEPQYKVAEADGRKTVARNGSKEREFKGALMVNAVCRCTGKSQVYPMLQFGVTPDDSLLAFFMGGGFRFLRPKGLSMSFGAVVTRSKDLDKLRVDSPVTDQGAIDSDLKERSVIKPYFSVQFKF
jgi:hypothetical protein